MIWSDAGYYEVLLIVTFDDKKIGYKTIPNTSTVKAFSDLTEVSFLSSSTDHALNPTFANDVFELLLIDPCWETTLTP
jgi:hypothetical protein